MPAYPELNIVHEWFRKKKWTSFPFQEEAWKAFLDGKHGLVNAPTGSGKTYALFIGAALDYIRKYGLSPRKKSGLQLIWITPIRALSKDIRHAAEEFCRDVGLDWKIDIRTGDTSSAERQKQRRNMPQMLITTPESLHLLLATKDYPEIFQNLNGIVADEWHELMGSKRAVMLELALSRLKSISNPKIWAISATIGNMDEALDVLLGTERKKLKAIFIKADTIKPLEILSIIPEEIERFSWAGHLGTNLAHRVLPIIENSKTTLLFTNTRSQAELWYQKLLSLRPELAGVLAMHHGSVSRELRDWVEDALHTEKLKCVVCTSSLDLGVDFRPVETIIQVGSPKGVARFMQRAGRSGHRPGEKSRIYFLPTHSLQLIECAALRRAVENKDVESRVPYIRSFDVLVQYLITLAVSDGFHPAKIYKEIKKTYSFASIDEREWAWCLDYITRGGKSLYAYDEYKKVDILEDGTFKVSDRRIAMKHRLSIGTIVSDTVLQVKFVKGGYLGSIEEWFISRLKPGDMFWFVGRPLELVRVKEMTVQVKMSKQKKGTVPSWQGGRMPLSAQLSENLRYKIQEAASGESKDPELIAIQPIIELQRKRSAVPALNEFLIEKVQSKEGCHIFMYPFEGRFVHEGIAALMAYRISLLKSISFSIAFNDYGLELLSDQDIPIEDAIDNDFFSTEYLGDDIRAGINSNEMARRKFRDIAGIAGLVFKGYPGHYQKDKHLQSSSQLFFEVFKEYEPENLLYKQAYTEVMEFQVEEVRLRRALDRINSQKIVLTFPEKISPFAFPIMVDRFREKFTSESIEDRVKKMTVALEK